MPNKALYKILFNQTLHDRIGEKVIGKKSLHVLEEEEDVAAVLPQEPIGKKKTKISKRQTLLSDLHYNFDGDFDVMTFDEPNRNLSSMSTRASSRLSKKQVFNNNLKKLPRLQTRKISILEEDEKSEEQDYLDMIKKMIDDQRKLTKKSDKTILEVTKRKYVQKIMEDKFDTMEELDQSAV